LIKRVIISSSRRALLNRVCWLVVLSVGWFFGDFIDGYGPSRTNICRCACDCMNKRSKERC